MSESPRSAAAVLALALLCVAAPAMAAPIKGKPAHATAKSGKPPAKVAPAAPRAQPPPEAVTNMAQWVTATDDNDGRPFVIIDKVAARVFVFRPDGALRGAAPALLGYARGDNSTPGVGDREMSDIPPRDRTTPAGRFVAGFGAARGQQKVLWVDYATAISMHPVVTSHPLERRPQRLASATPKDNRITYGCINVSPAFYEKVVRKAFAGTRGIVYILPEKTPLEEVFPAYRVQSATAGTAEPGTAAVDVAAASHAPG